ncbi:histidine kinase [Kibdelosporangium persicum]|uniref:histidine kinase n=1 Tax=Kibdelosporangium persicum TaxID=2698649 RepID=A0ABX2F477_9PSEU|nr:histidine kinase [Kibdelosporangium persicum]NRN66052.1 Signal transduction histidine kinase [Kibdelosporangium persicum]
MLREHALALVRGLALFGLSLVAAVQSALAIVVSCAGVLAGFKRERWLPNLVRRLVARWTGLEIPVPYWPEPGPPRPERDGWYRWGNQLYRKPGPIARMQRFRWLLKDPATHRDHIWALTAPVTSALTVGLPAVLVVAGFLVHPLAALPMAAVGGAAAPALLRIYSHWTGALLRPTTRTGRTSLWAWVMGRANVLLKLAATFGLSLIGVVHVGVTAVTLSGFLGPFAAQRQPSRTFLNRRRRQIGAWTGVRIDVPYLPMPPPPAPRPDGKYQHGRMLYDSPHLIRYTQTFTTLMKDKATWRDPLYLILDPLVSLFLAIVPVVLVVGGFFGYFWTWMWSRPISFFAGFDITHDWGYLGDLFPALRALPGWLTPVAGLAAAIAGLLVCQACLTAHGHWSKWLLGPTRSAQLAQQVDHLRETRSEATDAQAAELRRIERDLHDGAQARWVAMGLNLSVVERLIDQDPEAAKKLVANARGASAEALVELRQLVRGILPPVLAERGLGDAVRALALDNALTVHVAVDLPGRVDAPVEAAVYFAISEVLTNAAKHGQAEQVSVDLRHVDGKLRATVADDGRGGADPAQGSGLRGIQRRLATFDGVLTLTSPSGGPTTVTLEVPCALSSPRTSTSSETA